MPESARPAGTRLLAPPLLADEDQSRSARVLHACLLVSVVADVAAYALTAVTSPVSALGALPWYAISVAVALGGLWALRRGYVRAVGVAYLAQGFLIVAVASWMYGGLDSTVPYTNLVFVAAAGLVFGSRGAVVGSLTAVAIGLALALGKAEGWIAPPSPSSSVVVYILEVSLVGGLLAIADRALKDALDAARAARDEAKKASDDAKKAGDAARHTSTTLDDVVRSIADALALVAPDGRVLRTNPALDDLVGRDDLVGQRFDDLFLTLPHDGQAVLKDVDGHGIDVAVSRGELGAGTSAGASAGVVWVLRDVRREREAERRLRDAADAAEAANHAKSQFLANMSHELRTPLNAIIGYAEMLREDARDQRVIGDLDKIEASGQHLLALINDVLDLSKIEAGKMELHAEDFDVAAMCRDVAATIEPLVARNKNRLDVELEPGLGRMRSDVVRVRQVLFNLLSNAAKFTTDGTVSFRARRKGRELELEVGDTGIGMDETTVARLFKPFTQADASTTRRYGGSGLGLALVRHFSRMLGGDVSVTSRIGQGTTFRVRLPCEGAEMPAVESEATMVPTAQGAVVLAIDDDPKVHDLLARTLEAKGIRVVSALTGAEGITLARRLRPRAITLDVMMPGLDGWAVLAALKGDPVTAGIPVAMLTIVDGEVRGREAGAAAWLLKPIERRRLLDVMGKLVGHAPQDVLVVDDDPSQRELAARALVAKGCTVRTAADGPTALAAMREKRPGLVLLDVRMPGLDGFDVLDAMRADPELADVPVVVLTAADLGADERRRLAAATGVLVKSPDRAAQIVEALSIATPEPAPARGFIRARQHSLAGDF